MKKLLFITLLFNGFLFQNCNNSKKEKEVIITEKIEKPVSQDIENLKDIDTLVKIKNVIDSDIQVEEIIETEKGLTKDEISSEITTTKEIKPKAVEETIKDVEVETTKNTTTEIETPNIEEVVKEDIIEPIEETKEEVVKETQVKEIEVVEEKPEIVETPKEVTTNSDKWIIPSKYKTMTNPEDASKSNIAIGKSLYSKHCKSCHGKEGYGDGPKADEVEGDLGDFTLSKFKAQSDGALFYKSYIGRDDMPNYEKKMSEEDVWLVLHYMKTL